jgi:hypothetical protein
MGLNLVIGCHAHQERIWFFRGHLEGMESFYRAHWNCPPVLSDDQSDIGERMYHEYADVSEKHKAWEPAP